MPSFVMSITAGNVSTADQMILLSAANFKTNTHQIIIRK
jgi:hypothetical protein